MKRIIVAIWLVISAFTLPNSFVSSTFFDGTPQLEQSFVPFIEPTHVDLHERIVEGTKKLYASQYFTGTTHYFSSSGSTGNTGLSVSSPWPWSKVSTTGVAGDSLLFKKGDTFSGTVNYTRSGSAGLPIVFDQYGTATANPIIDGGNTGTPAITLTGSFININNVVLQNSASVNGNLYVTSANHDINIYNVYCTGSYRGFYFYQCGASGVANITVKNCYFYNIGVGGSRASGSGSSNQMNGCNGSGIEVSNDFAQIDMTLSEASRDGVGDVFNFYQCNGTSGSWITIHDLKVRGGGSSQSGYAGLIEGDVGGSYQNAYNCIFVNSGAEGAQIQGGHDIILNNCQMYSPLYDYGFEGIGFANYAGAPCYNIAITNNRVNWYNKGGSHIAWFQDNSGNSNSTGAAGGAALTADFTGTTSQFSFDSGMNNSILSDPLWTGSPWNTATTPLSFSPLSNTTLGASDFSPGAVSSSNQGITYTSDNSSVATIVSGKIHVIAAGTANITANDQFNTVTQTLTVLTSSTTIKFKRKIHVQ